MITAKQISKLCENWISSPVIRGSLVDVYKNPGSSDYKELNIKTKRGRVRFIADAKSQMVFVWDAYLSTHFDVADKLKNEGYIKGSVYRDTLLRGEAILSGNSAKMTDTDTFNNMDVLVKTVKAKKKLGVLKEYLERYEEIFQTDWSWIDRFLNCKDYLSGIKSQLDEVILLYKNYDNSKTSSLFFSEDYLQTGIAYGKQFDIYTNPTISDFVKLRKTALKENRRLNFIRFIVDAKNKLVYVADAHLATHTEMENLLGLSSNYLESPWLLEDMVKLSGDKPKLDLDDLSSSLTLSGNIGKDKKLINWFETRFSYDWTFADTYIDGISSAMEFYQKKYRKALKD